MKGQYIPKNIKERVEQELESGEVVEWLGLRLPHYFKPSQILAFMFGISWTGFTIFWTFEFAKQKDPIIAILIGIPFALAGLAILYVAFIWAYHKPLKTIYVITNNRAIIIEEWYGRIIQSFYPYHLQDIYCREKKNGIGDVIITCRAIRESKFIRQSERFGFLRIKNPKEMEKKLKKLAEQSAEVDVE
jgi:hypothetical protein